MNGAPPFAPQQLDHLVLRVIDLERSIAFYRDVLGCTLVRWRDELGLVHLRAGTTLIDLIAVDGELGRPGGAPAAATGRNLEHFCLRIEPFDADLIRSHLRNHGIAMHGDVEDRFGAEDYGPSLYIEDPDGNVVELKGVRAAQI